MKKIISLLFALAIFSSLFSFSAFAANTADITYKFASASSGNWHNCIHNWKTNASQVYVRTITTPGNKVLARTMCNVGGSASNQTYNSNGYVTLANKKKYAIKSWVYERGDYTTGSGVKVWLSFKPSATGLLEGVWSPDWSQTGTDVTILG